MSSAAPTVGVSFKDVAHLVNLEPEGKLQDALTVELSRARIPNGLFIKIIDGLDTVTRNFGQMHDLDNGEARSRLMAPVCIPRYSLPARPVC